MKTKVISLPKQKQVEDEINEDQIKDRLSIAKCREILQEEGQLLSDEEILKVRDYLYMLAAIGWEEYLQKQQQVHLDQHQTDNNEESHYLRAG
jgi:hypothetical protein